MYNRNPCTRAHGVAAPGIHLQHVSVSRHKQAELRQLPARARHEKQSTPNTREHRSQVVQGQKAFPDAHGEVGMHTRTITATTTSMPGRAHPAKEGLGAEAGKPYAAPGICALVFQPPHPHCHTQPCHILLPRPQGQTARGSLALEEVTLAVYSWQDPKDSPPLTHQLCSQAWPIR